MKIKVTILSLIVTIFATSCGVNYHLRKAIKKGYRCEEVADTIQVMSIDSFPVIVHDSIVWEKVITQKDTIIVQKRSFVPKTRYQTRIEYKLKHDTIVQTQKIQVAKYKSQRQKSPFYAFFIGLIIGALTMWLFRFTKSNL